MKPESWGLTFHHFGLAVRQPSRALTVIRGLGYTCGEPIHDPLQNVVLIWCEHTAMPAIEVVSPSDRPGPLDNLLSRNSELLYHLCYSAKRISESVKAIKAAGIRVVPVVEPKPAVLFGGRHVGFYQLRGFGLIEIVEEE